MMSTLDREQIAAARNIVNDALVLLHQTYSKLEHMSDTAHKRGRTRLGTKLRTMSVRTYIATSKTTNYRDCLLKTEVEFKPGK